MKTATGYPSFEKESFEAMEGVWFFLALKNHLPHDGDYILRKIYDEELIVRNGGGQIRVFLNRCIHRGAPIFNEERGNASMKCNFHGWSFGDDGNIAGIPFDKYYYHLDEQRPCLKLIEFKIACVGGFIFMNFSPDPPPINQQFTSAVLTALAEISEKLDDFASFAEIRAECNWKYLCEITMDPLHVPFVHSNTFAKLRPFKPGNVDKVDNFKEKSKLVEMSTISEQRRDAVPLYPWRKNVNRWGSRDVYIDFMIFPNLHLVTSDGGYSFSYEAYFPVNFGATKIEYMFTTAKRDSDNVYFPIIHLESMKVGMKIYLEDVVMAESLQKNSNSFFDGNNPGSYEVGIYRFRNFFKAD